MAALRTIIAAVFVLGCSGSDGAPPANQTAADGGVAESGAVDGDVTDGAAVDSAPVDAPTGTPNVPGKHVHKEMLDGMEREFIVYVPEKARGGKAVPVVFMLHGTSGDGEKFFQISRWKEKSDAEGIITVYPSALTYCLKEDENGDGDFDDPGERHVTTKWASGQLGDPARMPLCSAAELAELSAANRALADHPLKDDLAFFKFMLEFLGKKYSVDAKRVYASGFSNGAQMTSRFAVDMADRFAAVAAHAGPMAVTPTPPARPITVVFSVGNIDDRFTPVGMPIPISEATAMTPAFARITGSYLAATQLANKYTYDQPKVGARELARWTYTTSNIGATNRFVTVLLEGCSHEYPNGTNHPLVMADALWELFKTQSLP